jgi:hypothetical protein
MSDEYDQDQKKSTAVSKKKKKKHSLYSETTKTLKKAFDS